MVTHLVPNPILDPVFAIVRFCLYCFPTGFWIFFVGWCEPLVYACYVLALNALGVCRFSRSCFDAVGLVFGNSIEDTKPNS